MVDIENHVYLKQVRGLWRSIQRIRKYGEKNLGQQLVHGPARHCRHQRFLQTLRRSLSEGKLQGVARSFTISYMSGRRWFIEGQLDQVNVDGIEKKFLVGRPGCLM